MGCGALARRATFVYRVDGWNRKIRERDGGAAGIDPKDIR
jgi:hypothetical protein